MKVLFINTSDRAGGAAIAAYRLLNGIQAALVDATMLVREKLSDNTSVWTPRKNMMALTERIKPHIERMPLKHYPNRRPTAFNIQWAPGVAPGLIRRARPDLIHLHWFYAGFLRIEAMSKLGAPIVWTLHDMWAFTGGCNYSFDCKRYEEQCGACPQLGSLKENDLSRWIWKRKKKSWPDLIFTVVTPSRWLADCASKSSLFHDRPIKVIPYGIDAEVFRPHEKWRARARFNLPQDKLLVLFSASGGVKNIYKGFNHLRDALKKITTINANIPLELVVAGNPTSESAYELEFPVHDVGHVKNEQDMAFLYSAADLFAAPSIQDNLPNAVMEALSCGLPCVAFRIGGMPDMIEHEKNGYLAEPFDADDLAHGINWILEDQIRIRALAKRARQKVLEEFRLESVVKNYLILYDNVLSKNK